MIIKLSAITDIGKARANNEDAFAICPSLLNSNWEQEETASYIPIEDTGSIMIVADGMGGPEAGEVASHIAIESIKKSFTPDWIAQYTDVDKKKSFLQNAVERANNAIEKTVEDNFESVGMGTTLVLCWIFSDMAYIAWCGDSRCYVYNPIKGLTLLTKDHSYVQELVDCGDISENEAFMHPESNIITRGLGDLDIPANPDIITCSVSPNDMFLLCSDGLSGLCRDRDIESVLDQYYTDITQCKKKLLKLALDAGGDDNICIALASVIADNKECPDVMTCKAKIKRFFRRFIG